MTQARSVPINKIFQPLYTSKKRYFLLTGGRASLKSSTVHDFVARLTYEKGHGILFTRFTMKSAEKSIIPEFSIVLNRLGITQDFKVTKNVVTNLHTGSFIYFSGIKTNQGDQTANLKSIAGITTLVVEEGEDFNDESKFDTIDDSIRTSEKQNRIIWIQNPTTKEHFVYTRWIAPANKQINVNGYNVTVSNMPDVEHIHSSYLIAEQYLSEGWMQKANRYKEQAEQEDKLYRQTKGDQGKKKEESHYYYNYIGGWLERAEGVIFDNWQEGEFDDSLPYCYGLDYGYSPDPTAMPKIAVDDKRKLIYAKEIIYQTELDDIPARLEIEEISKRDLIVADLNELRTTAAIRKKGYNIQNAAKGAGSIAQDIRDIKQYTIIVDPDSPNLKKELNNYVWNDKKASIPIDDYNHLMDAMRYAFRRLVRKSKGVRRRN